MRAMDITGQRYGRLVAMSSLGRRGRDTYWLCACDCGASSEVRIGDLRSGNTSSCGCLGRERRNTATSKSNTTHGMSKTKVYGVWFCMKRRCDDPAHKSYPDYGGRGISYCPEWQSFEGFLVDMGAPDAGMTLERKDVNGNYEYGNCVWATQKEQSRNRRSNHMLTCLGETKTVVEWSEDPRCACSYDTLSKRVTDGWSDFMAITTPTIRGRPPKNFDKAATNG